jgi:hypothetical protein
LLAKTDFRPLDIQRLYSPPREQAPSYGFGGDPIERVSPVDRKKQRGSQNAERNRPATTVYRGRELARED